MHLPQPVMRAQPPWLRDASGVNAIQWVAAQWDSFRSAHVQILVMLLGRSVAQAQTGAKVLRPVVAGQVGLFAR